MANNKGAKAERMKDGYYIITDDKVIYGPDKWSGKLVDLARWYREIVRLNPVRIVQVVVDEEAI